MTLTSLVAVQSNIHPGPNLPGQVSFVAGIVQDATCPASEQGLRHVVSAMALCLELFVEPDT